MCVSRIGRVLIADPARARGREHLDASRGGRTGRQRRPLKANANGIGKVLTLCGGVTFGECLSPKPGHIQCQSSGRTDQSIRASASRPTNGCRAIHPQTTQGHTMNSGGARPCEILVLSASSRCHGSDIPLYLCARAGRRHTATEKSGKTNGRHPIDPTAPASDR